MKNIDQKTLIFYTFQLNPQLQYNVTALKNDISEPKIKDILWHLPVDLQSGQYHFRFKSEFQQGDQKIVGWIDIMNLMAKVPFFNNSIYVKILKLQEGDRSKIFTREKLEKVGLIVSANGSSPLERKNNEKSKTTQSPSNIHHSHSLDPRTTTNHLQTSQQKASPHKPKSQLDISYQNSASNRSNHGSYSNLDASLSSKSVSNLDKVNENLMGFSDQPKSAGNKQYSNGSSPIRKVAPETPEQILARMKIMNKKQQQEKNLELQARDELQQKINRWGYSGKKIINNLTTLLATLHEIWPAWDQVSLGDLQKEDRVYALYKKAAIQTHPDKNRLKDFRSKYLAKRVFELINEAKKQNQLQQQALS